MAIRSDRLKKLEAELHDLEEWLRLGLVPKKDIEKHKTEIEAIKKRVAEEEEKLRFLKETGEADEYVTPRRQASRSQYTEAPTMPDVQTGEEAATLTEAAASQADTVADTVVTEELTASDQTVGETTEEEDPFSDRARWKRGMLHDTDEEW